MALLYCNGEEELDTASLGERERKFIEELVSENCLEASETPLEPLKPWQRYIVYNSRFVQIAHWSITGKCNFKCRHCLLSAPDAHLVQLPLSDCLKIVDEIYKCGIKRVDVTGGEPLVRTDFEEIVKALSERHIDIGLLFTNASLLTSETLDMFERYHMHPNVQISYDGLGHHDWLRGVSGAEADAQRALKLLKERNYITTCAMCIHKENMDSLNDTIDYMASLGVRALRVNAPQELGVWKQYAAEYALNREEVWNIYKGAIRHFFKTGMPIDLELDGFFFCKAGETNYKVKYVRKRKNAISWDKVPYCESVRYNVYIAPDGALAPCMGFAESALKDTFPNVLQTPLGELTQRGTCHDIVETKISKFLARNPECKDCEYLDVCMGGCMVADITDEGDYLVPDKNVCYFHKHIGEEATRKFIDEAIAEFCNPEQK
ncbi:MAG: radical SAM protein [Saccharofermentans sp.]|nr:radical SAM protein [Saccharofermentans sp.]